MWTILRYLYCVYYKEWNFCTLSFPWFKIFLVCVYFSWLPYWRRKRRDKKHWKWFRSSLGENGRLKIFSLFVETWKPLWMACFRQSTCCCTCVSWMSILLLLIDQKTWSHAVWNPCQYCNKLQEQRQAQSRGEEAMGRYLAYTCCRWDLCDPFQGWYNSLSSRADIIELLQQADSWLGRLSCVTRYHTVSLSFLKR